MPIGTGILKYPSSQQSVVPFSDLLLSVPGYRQEKPTSYFVVKISNIPLYVKKSAIENFLSNSVCVRHVVMDEDEHISTRIPFDVG